MTARRNALLAVPPRGAHGLDVAGGRRFRQAVGRAPLRSDYEGVHTSGNDFLAATYAVSTAKKDDSYPVVVALDVTGLKAIPDVDALAAGHEMFYDQTTRKEVMSELRRGQDMYSIAESFSMNEEHDNPVGEDVTAVFFEETRSRNPAAVLQKVFGDDPVKMGKVLRRWLAGGEIPAELMMEIVDQRRYMHDFNVDRVLKVYAVKRWWDEVLDDWWERDDAEGRRMKKQAEEIEAAGYRIFTFEDVVNYSWNVESKVIFDSRLDDAKAQYHGTSALRLQQAFPELAIPADPFPVVDV